MGTAPPDQYIEYLLKSKFGWTHDQLEAEPAENIEHYLYIMSQEASKQNG